MTPSSSSRLFWLLFLLVSLGCAVVAYRYFPLAFPLVTLDLQMDREAALAASRDLAERYELGPPGYRQAASFQLDSRVQNFVELEAGGTEGFREMLRERFYSPYTWYVRHFKEGETLETRFTFTPRGEPLGLSQKLPEDEPGASLAPPEARAIAEETARRDWAIDLDSFELVESAQELRPGGRTDHTFVYRRRDVRIGDGEYRLRLVVGGDRLTEVSHFVKVPEAFSRRYEEMRSANDAIAVVASVAMIVLYVVGGCIVGTFYLLRKRWIIARPPILWGFSISGLQVLASLNQWPLLWLSYDTALGVRTFILGEIATLAAMFLGMGILLSLSFMAAEGLTRRAFGSHIRLWSLWSAPVAATPAVAGRTLAGYLLVAVFFAYEVALYFFSSNWLGWWTPSSALFDPDVLATYFPWLTSVAVSLQAGFWEECLFRAVPIAGAALIGERLGRRRAWIVGAFILQGLVFGAGHANYPAQPAYARAVELVLPSFFFGWIYLRYGLLASIVLHFAFDVTWIAMPLFISQAPGTRIDQVLVILLTLVPLWVVLAARVRVGAWKPLGENALNRSWERPPPLRTSAEAVGGDGPKILPRTTRWVVPAAGVSLLGVWLVSTDFETVAPPLEIEREVAVGRAREALAARGIALGLPWRELATVEGRTDLADRFVWREGGETVYRDLLGSYLSLPHFEVRLARFEGDVAERAEEYQIAVGPRGDVLRFRHRVPEARPGDRLTEEEARRLVGPIIGARYHLDPTTLDEISAAPSRHPNRDDWTFTFADRRRYPLTEGEARITVVVAGSEISDAYRWVHLPEDWRRRERDEAALTSIVRLVCIVVLSAGLMAGIAGGIVAWSRKRFALRHFLGFFALLAGLGLVQWLNSWPETTAQFSTAQPWMVQTGISAALGIVALLVAAATPALIIGFVHGWGASRSAARPRTVAALGLALGAAAAGLLSIAQSVGRTSDPPWADYSPAATFVPLLDATCSPVIQYVRLTAGLLLLYVVVDRFSEGWRRRRATLATGLFAFGVAAAGLASTDRLEHWLLSGLVTGFVFLAGYIGLIRFDSAVIPPAVAAYLALNRIAEGVHGAYTAALPGAVLAVSLILWISILWSGELRLATLEPSMTTYGRDSSL